MSACGRRSGGLEAATRPAWSRRVPTVSGSRGRAKNRPRMVSPGAAEGAQVVSLGSAAAPPLVASARV